MYIYVHQDLDTCIYVHQDLDTCIYVHQDLDTCILYQDYSAIRQGI